MVTPTQKTQMSLLKGLAASLGPDTCSHLKPLKILSTGILREDTFSLHP